jgi:transcriptional regulator with XRE-family HTH domain
VRDDLGLSQNEMAAKLGIRQSTYSNMEKGEKSNLSIDHMNTLVDLWNINPKYLLNGDEPMYDSRKDSRQLDILENSSFLVPVSAQAGYIDAFQDGTSTKLPQVIIPGVAGSNTRVFEISGDSMVPVVLDGDFVACTKVEDVEGIRDGLLYIIVSTAQGVSLKYLQVRRHSVKCMPHDTVNYQPFELDYSEISEVWEVRVRVTKHILNNTITTTTIGRQSGSLAIEELVKKLSDQQGL